MPDETTTVTAAGMGYVHIPVTFNQPTEAEYARFRSALADIGDAPIHVHCIVNMRVAAFSHRYRRESLGWDEAAPCAPMESIWCPGGVWPEFIGDTDSAALPHRPPR